MRLAVLVPTYNEVNNVETLISAISAVSAQHSNVELSLILVDDSSPDGTADFVQSLAPHYASSNFSVTVLVKENKAGLGAAYIFAFNAIREAGFDYVLQMDADLSHDPKYITGFIHQAQLGTELVVASRYIPGGGTPDWSLDRRILSRGGNLYTRLVLSSKITDYTGGFNMFSARLLQAIAPDSISATGYGFIIVLKYRALLEARSYAELPIVFLDRTHGTSKIPKSTLFQNLILVPKVRSGRV